MYAQENIPTVDRFIDSLDTYHLVYSAGCYMQREHAPLFNLYDHVSYALSRDAYGFLYQVTAAKTYLKARFWIEGSNKTVQVRFTDMDKYITGMAGCIYNDYEIKDVWIPPKKAVEEFLDFGKCPPQIKRWLVDDFFNGNSALAQLLLPPSGVYPDYALEYVYRGISDIIGPIHNALNRKPENELF